MSKNSKIVPAPLRTALICLAWVGMLMAGGCATKPVPPVVAPPPAVQKPLIIGLALGGGAARGFAHVGVIAVLEEAGLRPQLVVGTSAGSLVAALYASGKTSAQLEQAALNMDEVAITDWMLPIIGRGIFRGDALARYVNELVSGKLIENMVIPLGIVSTDLASGNAVLFQRGDTGTAVRASSAVPAVFVPVKIHGREYVDGGLVSPVPVHFANHYELAGADIVVRPSLVGLKSADFSSRQRAIDAGRAAMLAALPALKAKLAAEATSSR
jgi:NTE family protein